MSYATTDEVDGAGGYEVYNEQMITPDGVLPVVLLRIHQISGEDRQVVEAYMARAVLEDLIGQLLLALDAMDPRGAELRGDIRNINDR